MNHSLSNKIWIFSFISWISWLIQSNSNPFSKSKNKGFQYDYNFFRRVKVSKRFGKSALSFIYSVSKYFQLGKKVLVKSKHYCGVLLPHYLTEQIGHNTCGLPSKKSKIYEEDQGRQLECAIMLYQNSPQFFRANKII